MRRFNLNEFFWFLILLSFSTYTGYLLFTGEINYFIHPKMLKYIMITSMGFCLLTIYQFTKIFSITNRRPLKKGYLLFMFSLVLSVIPSQGMDTSIASNKGVTVSESAKSDTAKNNTYNEASYIHNDTVIMDDERYYRILNDIFNNIDKYKGKKIIIKGFVFKDKGFEKNQFVSARMMMSCCAADAQVIGLMCRWNSSKLNKDEWVQVEGKIDSTFYKDKNTNQTSTIPIIIVDKVEKIEKPSNQYVYP